MAFHCFQPATQRGDGGTCHGRRKRSVDENFAAYRATLPQTVGIIGYGPGVA